MFLQHDVHDSKYNLIYSNLNSLSFFPGQRIPALNDLPLLTGNDYAWHARPFNEVRIKGFTDWISDVQRCSTFFFPDMIIWYHIVTCTEVPLWQGHLPRSYWINHAKASSLSNSMICFLQGVLPNLVLSPMAFFLGVPAASIRVIQRCLAARLSIRWHRR